MSWLEKIIPGIAARSEAKRSNKVPEGLWEK